METTCTAPGHPECTITCNGGCIAWYWEPNGPCTTMCTGAPVPIRVPDNGDKSTVSATIERVPLAQLADIFSELLADDVVQNLRKSNKVVSVQIDDVSLDDFARKLSSQ